MRRTGGYWATAWHAGWPRNLPAEIQGVRRMDPRCESCVHFRVYRGPDAWIDLVGGVAESWGGT